ncbi:hypothetical protein DEO72_LG2g3198 [Vigna unguiculata]|uniref:Uncharacterized protein n=1 Tax=Vigna unguiculata TaxID=3917 RepID=A0A4D6L2U1_VIGUN|nr:hypothetical protein DEO72_LG2g3198 [Vigna unguiculata]
MSSEDPPQPPPVDKGKGIAKTRKRHMPSLSSPPPPTGLHNPTSIPTIHMSSSSSQPPPTGLHTPVVAPRPPSVPPSHISSSSSSAAHTGLHTPSTDIGASPSPHTVPSPASISGPSSAVGQQFAPSPVAGRQMKNFRLGFLKLDLRFPYMLMEHKSSPLLILHRTRISGLGPNENLNQVPASSSSNTKDLTNIRQQLSRSLEENEQLRSEFRSFQSLVLQYLPPDAQACL